MKKFVNILTIIRLLSTIILPVLWLSIPPLCLFSFIIFILLTDCLDGFFARHFHVQSLFGSIMDTIADKTFGIVLLFIVSSYYSVFYILLFMEILIAVFNVIAAVLGATTKSSFLGKCKMWILGISLVLGTMLIFESDLNYLSFIFNYIDYDRVLMFVYFSVGADIIVLLDYGRHVIKELYTEKTKLKYNIKEDDELKYALFNTEYYLENKDKPLSKLLLK